MASVAAILFLVYLCKFSSGYVLMDDEDNEDRILTLPYEYNIKAERIDLLTDLKFPMELWYSAEYNRSRVDVYGGSVKRYFYWGWDGASGDNGSVYMIYPKWTEKEGHTTSCGQTYMMYETPTDAFPTEEDYVYLGKKWHEGRKLDTWKYTEDYDDTTRTLVLFSYRTERGEDIPVQILEKKVNNMKGSIDKHVIYNYDHFSSLFCEEDLDAEREASCEELLDDFEEHMKVLHPVFHTDLDLAFNSFKKHHSKEYSSLTEHVTRKEIFHKNWQYVVSHNQQNLGFKLAMNHLSDLTPAERARMNGARRSSKPYATLTYPYSEEEVRDIVTQIPEEYDMRLEGFISPIKNQDKCGSCWTFATTAAVEGALARLDGRILDLSEQSVVDCSWEGDNSGCDGGFPNEALKHILKHGIPLEEDYGGYLAENGHCHLDNATELFRIRGYTMVTPQSVNAMKVALYKYGPVIVTIETTDAFSFYSSGVFYDTSCRNDYTNHAVTIVGYGTRDGTDYWIVKNSYGQQWGEDGYILMSSSNNNCLILDEPYYPVV